MLILLPPSEGKSAPEAGAALDLSALSFPTLTATRKAVLAALVRLCRGDVGSASAALGLGPTQHGEVGANARLRREPCAPAIEVYTGVLYEALDAQTLTSAARRRLGRDVAIASGLWGLVRPDDPIPSYRLSAGTTLPGLGTLASAWRAPLASTLSQVDGLIVDLRSGGYVSLGPLPDDERTVTVRVLQERAGRRTVVSHHNKATKGRILRDLAATGGRPRTPTELADTLSRLGYRCELTTDTTGPCRLDVVVDAV